MIGYSARKTQRSSQWAAPKQRPHVRPILEILEDRLAPATACTFDGTCDGFTLAHFPDPDPSPTPVLAQVLPGGPDAAFLRLASAPAPHLNTITFARTDAGAFRTLVATFDFRITPVSGRADGFGFALLNTTFFGTTGNVTLASSSSTGALAEEPNFVGRHQPPGSPNLGAGSVGVGFDVYPNLDLGDLSGNAISLHFNGLVVAQKDVSGCVDLARGGSSFIRARLELRPGTTLDGGDVSVYLTPLQPDMTPQGLPCTVYERHTIPGFIPFEGRVFFGARSGGLAAHHDLDNINVTFADPVPQSFAWTASSFTAVERGNAGGGGSAQVSVRRLGSSNSTATVDYLTSNGSAVAPADYTTTAGRLTFAPGETLHMITVPLQDDPSVEADETFQAALSNPSPGAVLGATATATITIRDVDDDPPEQVGQWSAPIPFGFVAIHTHVLPTGEVMYWEDRHLPGDPEHAAIGEIRLWNPTTGAITTPAMLPGYDVFCAGHSFLADGRLFVTGGHDAAGDGIGLDRVSTYNPFSGTWDSTLPVMTNAPGMTGRRWYPTNTALPNGDVLVTGGSMDNALTPNPLPQVWQSATGTWRNLTNALLPLPLYPFMFLAPNGQVFAAGASPMTRSLDTAGTGAWSGITFTTYGWRDYGTAVTYEIGNRREVLLAGGTADLDRALGLLPTASAEVIDLRAAVPTWRAVSPMSTGRRHGTATLLPDGTVLVLGGTSSAGFNDATGAVFAPELYNPATETWTTLAPNQVRRIYHSTAVLLPDGRVLLAGGGQPAATDGVDHTDAEVYSPPYLFRGPRSVILAAPGAVRYGQRFALQIANGLAIARATLVRLPSTTHAFDQNQVLVHLTGLAESSGRLELTAPAGATTAPPGHYMLFLVDTNGVPSVARIIQLTNDTSGVAATPDAGAAPRVRILSTTGYVQGEFLAFGASFLGGVRLARTDLTGDGVPEFFAAPGPGGQPFVNVFDGRTYQFLRQLQVYGLAFTGGVNLAVADVLNQGRPQLIVAPGLGGLPVVNLFDAFSGSFLRSIEVYGQSFTHGVRITTADVNNDLVPEILTAPQPGGAPVVNIFQASSGTLLRSVPVFGMSFTGGLFVTAGDVTGDGRAEVLAAPDRGGQPVVNAVDPRTGQFLRQYAIFASSFLGGVRICALDVNRDGLADILGAPGPGGEPLVKVLDGSMRRQQLDLFFAYERSLLRGLFLACTEGP